jgi:hypothetical protein
MAQPNPTIGEVASVTIANYSKDAADNVSQHNALLYMIEKSGNTFDGGTQLQEIVEFAPNVNVNSYSGSDTLGTSSQDVLTTAVFPFKQYSAQVVFTGTEELQNAGKERMVPLVATRVKNAFHSIDNRLNQDLYTDGTGNAGKNITGLLAAVPLAPTNVYGGIDRSVSTNAFWKNYKFQASVDGSGAATVSNGLITQYFNTILPNVTRQKDKPKLIIAGIVTYAIFESGLQANQFITDADMASRGFVNIAFQGIPVTFDSNASGIASTTSYFLNTDYLEWRVHRDRNMVELEDKQSVNQDVTVKTIVWAGNLVCRGAFLQANFSNT